MSPAGRSFWAALETTEVEPALETTEVEAAAAPPMSAACKACERTPDKPKPPETTSGD